MFDMLEFLTSSLENKCPSLWRESHLNWARLRLRNLPRSNPDEYDYNVKIIIVNWILKKERRRRLPDIVVNQKFVKSVHTDMWHLCCISVARTTQTVKFDRQSKDEVLVNGY